MKCSGKFLNNTLIVSTRSPAPKGIAIVYMHEMNLTANTQMNLATCLLIARVKGDDNSYIGYLGDIPGVAIWLYHKSWWLSDKIYCGYIDINYEESFLKQKPIKLLEKTKCKRIQNRNESYILSDFKSKIIQSSQIKIPAKKNRNEMVLVSGRLHDRYHNQLDEVKKERYL